MPVATRAVGLQFVFDPDPMVYANAMLRVDEGLRDRTMPLLAAAEYAREDIRRHFLSESDPSGRRWEEWAESYAPRAAYWGNPGILRLGTNITVGGQPRGASELYNYVTNPKHYSIDMTTAYFTAGGMPKWGWWHQTGIPDRTTSARSGPSSELGRAFAAFGIGAEGGGAANPLPQRAFLGISAPTRALILQAFTDWFDRSIELFNTSTGKIGRRHAIRGETGFISRASVGKQPMRPRP